MFGKAQGSSLEGIGTGGLAGCPMRWVLVRLWGPAVGEIFMVELGGVGPRGTWVQRLII